jgi:hypothetical protein
MSKFVPFIALPRQGSSDDQGFRTGKLRIAKMSSSPDPIKSYSLNELTTYELNSFMAQLGYAEDAKSMKKSEMIEMITEEFAAETKQLSYEDIGNLTEQDFTAGNKVLRIAPDQSLKQALRSKTNKVSTCW